MDNLMYDDAADLFTDDCHAFHIHGREELKKSFNTFTTPRFEGTKKLFLKTPDRWYRSCRQRQQNRQGQMEIALPQNRLCTRRA